MATVIVPHDQDENQKVDENGEVVIAEAIFNQSKLGEKIYHTYADIVLVTLPFVIFFLLPCAFIIIIIIFCIGCVYSSRGASALRLYLTSNGLHYTSVCPTGCVCGNKFIPLKDIRDVSLQRTINVMPNFVDVNTYKLIITKNNLDKVEFNFIDNATDFCAAIKRQRQA